MKCPQCQRHAVPLGAWFADPTAGTAGATCVHCGAELAGTWRVLAAFGAVMVLLGVAGVALFKYGLNALDPLIDAAARGDAPDGVIVLAVRVGVIALWLPIMWGCVWLFWLTGEYAPRSTRTDRHVPLIAILATPPARFTWACWGVVAVAATAILGAVVDLHLSGLLVAFDDGPPGPLGPWLSICAIIAVLAIVGPSVLFGGLAVLRLAGVSLIRDLPTHGEESNPEGPSVVAVSVGGGKKQCGGCGNVTNDYAVRCKQCGGIFLSKL